MSQPWPESQSLPAHARLLVRQRSVQVIALFAVAAVVYRISLGDWSTADLIAPAIVLALEPITEWVIHVFVLHFRPKKLLGRTFDPLVSRKHRAHHAGAA